MPTLLILSNETRPLRPLPLNNLIKKFSNKSGLINAGIYHLSPEIFSNYKSGSTFSLEKNIFPAVAEKKELSFLRLDVDFMDIGIPDDYLRFCNWMKMECSFEL